VLPEIQKGYNAMIKMKSDAKILDYLRLARFDHWIKQLFILPGVVFSAVLVGEGTNLNEMLFRFFAGFVATSLVASSNYVINEWLDADFDRYHPTKKERTAVTTKLHAGLVYLEYFVFALLGLFFAYLVSWLVFVTCAVLLVMGILYNVKPFRTKDIPYLDVLSESINNVLRLLIGWFVVSSSYLPPITIVLGYWMGGAFLMATKRYAEYRMIDDRETAALYRRSFGKYTESSLLISAFFYALNSVFFSGIFMIKYRIEFLLAILPLCGLFCYYLYISQKNDSAAQKPEKIFREKGLILYVLLFILLVALLLVVDIPILEPLTDTTLIGAGR
jgi:4-hydroxybenzoate polyprenyltransferase